MRFEGLTPEQQEKAKACKTPEDFLALAKETGYELSDEELNSIAGGNASWDEIWDCIRDSPCQQACSRNAPLVP